MGYTIKFHITEYKDMVMIYNVKDDYIYMYSKYYLSIIDNLTSYAKYNRQLKCFPLKKNDFISNSIF